MPLTTSATTRPCRYTATCKPVSVPAATISSAAAWTSACRSAIGLEFSGQGLELVRGALLPPGGLLPAVQERALFGENQPGAAVRAGRELHGGEGNRHEVGFRRQRRGVDDPLLRDDVPVERLERHDRAAVRPAGGHLAAADPEVELVPE